MSTFPFKEVIDIVLFAAILLMRTVATTDPDSAFHAQP